MQNPPVFFLKRFTHWGMNSSSLMINNKSWHYFGHDGCSIETVYRTEVKVCREAFTKDVVSGNEVP